MPKRETAISERDAKPSTNGHIGILSCALRLHDQGYSIVPCRGKKPIWREWQQGRAGREELAAALQGTTLNIAIVLNQSNMIDVECDSPEAEVNLQAMFGGKIPPTPTWQSRRGTHRLFRRPDNMPPKAVEKVDGIEFHLGEGKGALSVVPPSVHPDGPVYTWLPGLSLYEVKLAELPEAVAERIRTEAAQPSAEPSSGDIKEGDRNKEMYKLACRLVEAKLPKESVETMLQAENIARCKPPLSAAEVAGIAKSACARKKDDKQTIAEILMDIAQEDAELWHTPNGTAYATITRDGHREHWPIRESGYREWLTKQLWARERKTPGSQTLQDVVNNLKAMARFDGKEHTAFMRVAEHEGCVYYDLCDSDWRAIEVDQTGWRIVDDPPVRFRRTDGMLPLPVPQQGGSVTDLRRFVNVTNEQWPLYIGWVIGAFRPVGPYAILKILAEHGCAKTSTCKASRSMIDPNTDPLRSPPRSAHDLMISAVNSWITGLDNVTHISQELSDAMCRLTHGGSMSTRKLYTDGEEHLLNARRPIILNGIGDMALSSDFMDRCLIVTLPLISDKQRRAEKVFWAAFAEAQPKILGALLSAVSEALRNIAKVEASQIALPRMADFAQWVIAAEPALGLEPGAFMAAYRGNRDQANDMILESSLVGGAVLAFLKKTPKFKGTATQLLHELEIGRDKSGKGWPANPRALSAALNKIAPNLRAAGMTIYEKGRDWHIETNAKTQTTQKNGSILTPPSPAGMTPITRKLKEVLSPLRK